MLKEKPTWFCKSNIFNSWQYWDIQKRDHWWKIKSYNDDCYHSNQKFKHSGLIARENDWKEKILTACYYWISG